MVATDAIPVAGATPAAAMTPAADATSPVVATPTTIKSTTLAGPSANSAPALAADTPSIPGQPASSDSDPRDTVPFLASDALEGRGVGSSGLDRAADFIAGEFAAAGLKPLPGQSDFFQPVEYRGAVSAGKQTSLSVASQKLKINTDYVPLNFSADGEFSGKAAFVGYGVSAPDAGYDDYAGIDVKGKIVLLMRYEPMDEKGASRLQSGTDSGWSQHATFGAKIKTAIAHGAAGALLVNSPESDNGALMSLSAIYGVESSGIPILNISQAAADRILAAGGAKDLKTLKSRIDSTFHPQSQLPAEVKISGRVQIQRSVSHIRNVMACVPGNGPHADEYVVIGGHYDHLGKGELGHNFGLVGSIYHGADDNASGSATVLELAARFAKRATPPERTLVFVCFTAEEEGLIGSHEFVTKAPIPINKIAAMLNFDMVGRMKDQILFVGGQGTAADFDAILAAAQQHSTLSLKSVGRGGMGPSDHMSFANLRVPVMFFFTGVHIDYHRPTDIASKINYGGIQEVADFAADVIDGMARMPREPYIALADSDSFNMFGYAAVTTPKRKVILGVLPDFGSENSLVGVVVSGITPGTPAEKAGLQNGDLIVRFGDQKIQNLMDLTAALNRASPGDKVKIQFEREKQTISAEVILAERKD